MIEKILTIITDIKPKSLFSKISSDKTKIVLTTSKEIPNLKIDQILIEINGSVKLFTKEINESFKFTKKSSLENLINDIYEILKCRLLPLIIKINYYDVWGNEKDGWDVNDIVGSSQWTEELLISEFDDILLSDKEIKELITKDFNLDINIEWSDYTILLKNGDYFSFGYYFNDRNGKPIGEIFISDDQKNIELLS